MTHPLRVLAPLAALLSAVTSMAAADRGDGAVEKTDISLAMTLFAVGPAPEKADCAALRWETSLPHESFELLRASSEKGPFSVVYRGNAPSFDDHGLEVGTTYRYRLDILDGISRTSSGVRTATPFAFDPARMAKLDLLSGAVTRGAAMPSSGPSGTLVDGRYYRWGFGRNAAGRTLWEKSSEDGRAFSDERILLDASSAPCLADCKLEAASARYVPEAGKVLFTAHWEKPSGYGEGRLFLATATPGGNAVFHGCERPCGAYVRDMSVAHADGRRYLVAASNLKGEGANHSIRIFRFADDLSGIAEVVAVVHPGGYRESPHIVAADGGYYLFSSQAAGWYPSAGAYAFAPSIVGPWSEARPIGDSATFSSQSGYIESCGSTRMVHGYRWIHAPGTADHTLLPIAFDNGRAFYDFHPVLLRDNAAGILVPVADAPEVSRGATATLALAGGASVDAAAAVDGDYRTAARGTGSKDWPVDLVIDLGVEHDLAAMQCSWFLHKGSEGFYAYTVDVRGADGADWTMILDRTDPDDPLVSKTYGFSYERLSGRARYVRLHVLRAHLQNNPSCWYTPTFPDVRIYATSSPSIQRDTPVPTLP